MRVAGARLVVDGRERAEIPIDGTPLRALAALAGADLDADFSAGDDTPALGDPDEPLAADHAAGLALGAWYAYGWRVLDEVAAGRAATRIQLWPEHFDAGCAVGRDGARANVGASPGDAGIGEPYLYVGPWGDERPGDASYWNAPFGATCTRAALRAAADPVGAGVAFLRRGLDLLVT